MTGNALNEGTSVDLGFAEPIDSPLHSALVPSKLGGKPCWLSYKRLPDADMLACGSCGEPMTFLCQLYTPRDDNEQAFHRMLFLFVCNSSKRRGCHRTTHFAKVLRSQLPADNEFYANAGEGTLSDETLQKESNRLLELHPLCAVCGCYGDKKCSKCQRIQYCGKTHQVADWKHTHKLVCCKESSSQISDTLSSPLLFPEYVIVIEQEPQASYKHIATDPQLPSEGAIDPQLMRDLMKCPESKSDKHFANFKERIDRERKQVLRYDLNGEPLWVSGEGLPTDEDIGKCECGANRRFEFQVMPQMLNYLDLDETVAESLDWGTLVVYTCSQDCDVTGHVYKQELLWKQDFSSDQSPS